MAEKSIPHNPDAERTVLGAILVDNQALGSAVDVIERDDFYTEAHRRIFAAMLSLSERDNPIDLVTLKDHLSLSGDLQACGGVKYLAGLLDGVPKISNVEHWARIIRERAIRRAAIRAGNQFVQDAYDDKVSTDELLDTHSQQLNKLVETRDTANTQTISEVLKEAASKLDVFTKSHGITGIPTSIPDLDNLTDGLQPGSLYVIAGRPSRGKSVFVTQLAAAAGNAGFPGLVFSLEMPPASVVQRMWLSDAGVNRFDLKAYDREEDWAQMAKSYAKLAGLPLWFDKRESPTLIQIKAHAKKFMGTVGLKFIVIDYLQRIPVNSKIDRHIAVGDICQALKSLALALKIPVVVACQLNRDAEEKRPTLRDLAESGRIERESDVILALHPKEPSTWYEPKDPEMELVVLKLREGATDILKLTFERRLTRFVPLGGITNWTGQL